MALSFRSTLCAPLLVSCALWSVSCGEPAIPFGTLGAACPNDRNCERPLVCRGGVCSNPEDAGAPIVDAGPDEPGPVDGGCAIPPTLLAIRNQVFGANDGDPHCNQVFCHGPQPAEDVQLTLPLPALHALLLGETRDQTAPQRNLVVPGDPDASRLWVIMNTPNPGGQGGRMPPEGLVPDCERSAVRRWILDGAPQN